MHITKKPLVSAISVALLPLSQPLLAEEAAPDNFEFTGDIRAGLLWYDYSNPDGLPTINRGHKDSEGFYIGSFRKPCWWLMW